MPADPAATGARLLVWRMARREARAHLLHPYRAAYLDDPPVRVAIVVRPCPWCGLDRVPAAPHARLAPLRETPVLPADRAAAAPVRLTALACESLTARSLLVLTRGGLPARELHTRASAAAQLPAGADLLSWLDAAESWLDTGGFGLDTGAFGADTGGFGLDTGALGAGAGVFGADTGGFGLDTGALGAGGGEQPRWGRLWTVPAATRLRDSLAPHFVTPHLEGAGLAGLNRAYLRWRGSAVAAGLRPRPGSAAPAQVEPTAEERGEPGRLDLAPGAGAGGQPPER